MNAKTLLSTLFQKEHPVLIVTSTEEQTRYGIQVIRHKDGQIR
jgi:hypothetical protein